MKTPAFHSRRRSSAKAALHLRRLWLITLLPRLPKIFSTPLHKQDSPLQVAISESESESEMPFPCNTVLCTSKTLLRQTPFPRRPESEKTRVQTRVREHQCPGGPFPRRPGSKKTSVQTKVREDKRLGGSFLRSHLQGLPPPQAELAALDALLYLPASTTCFIGFKPGWPPSRQFPRRPEYEKTRVQTNVRKDKCLGESVSCSHLKGLPPSSGIGSPQQLTSFSCFINLLRQPQARGKQHQWK